MLRSYAVLPLSARTARLGPHRRARRISPGRQILWLYPKYPNYASRLSSSTSVSVSPPTPVVCHPSCCSLRLFRKSNAVELKRPCQVLDLNLTRNPTLPSRLERLRLGAGLRLRKRRRPERFGLNSMAASGNLAYPLTGFCVLGSYGNSTTR